MTSPSGRAGSPPPRLPNLANGLAGRSFELPESLSLTSFEAAEGFTGYTSPNFAALGTKTDTLRRRVDRPRGRRANLEPVRHPA